MTTTDLQKQILALTTELKEVDALMFVDKSVKSYAKQITEIKNQCEKFRVEILALTLAIKVKDAAIQLILKDWAKFGESFPNVSDGEYTQDYTTRREALNKALSTPNTDDALKPIVEDLKWICANVDTSQTCSKNNEGIWIKADHALSLLGVKKGEG